jgi:copper resistance protein B
MYTRVVTILCLIAALFVAFSSTTAFAQGEHPDFFHAFTLDSDIGIGRNDFVGSWDLDGWLGGDFNKLWIKSEGELADSNTEQAELWALYSKNITEFWDTQVGIRYDFEPQGTSYLSLGIDGLAPYLFETEAHLFVSDKGDFSARFRQENDLLITQRLVMQPYIEFNLFAQDVSEQDVGAGISDGEFGLQTRYEITRKFAPYLDLRYERKIGESSGIARRTGELQEDFITSIGVKFIF